MERKQSRGGALRAENQFDEPAPKPIKPPAGFFKVTDVDPTELARQLCLIESRLYQAIKPKEYLGKAWERKDKEVVAPNLTAFILHFNRIGNWIAHSVIECPDEKKRVATVEYWIKVAERLFEMNNFAGVMEVKKKEADGRNFFFFFFTVFCRWLVVLEALRLCG